MTEARAPAPILTPAAATAATANAAQAALASPEALTAALAGVGYIASRPVATALYLAHHLRKPVLIEGPAGVGKTDLAVSAARALGFALLRLQCYEGLDDSKALYEWQYGKQLLYTQVLKEKIALLTDGTDSLAEAHQRLTGFHASASARWAHRIGLRWHEVCARLQVVGTA